MSLLYKDKDKQILTVQVEELEDKTIDLMFWKDCGKHGAHEIIDWYNLTPERLMFVLQSFDDYTEEELG